MYGRLKNRNAFPVVPSSLSLLLVSSPLRRPVSCVASRPSIQSKPDLSQQMLLMHSKVTSQNESH